MAKATYTCQFDSELSLSTRPSAFLSGPSTSIPEGAVIKDVSLSVYCGVSQWNQTVTCGMTLMDSGGNSASISDSCNTGSENRVWLTISGEPRTSLDWNSLSNVTLSGSNLLTVRSGYTATLTIEYVTYSKCSAPTKVELASTSVTPGAKVQLSWSGAKAGENVPIEGYRVYRATSADGDYSLLTSVSSNSTKGSTTVVAPTTNGAAYYYKVRTVGEVAGYYSEQSVVYAELTCSYAAVGAPTTLKLDITNVAPGAEATLSFSGATAGENNPITGYELYRATSADGEYSLLMPVFHAVSTVQVTAPTENGVTYYYKMKTLGTLEGTDSALSDTYTSLSCTYSAPNAPTTLTFAGQSSRYVLSGAMATLAWSGASAGANNPIVGYEIYRDGELYITGLTASTMSQSVSAHEDAGRSYQFNVVTKGSYSDSAQSTTAVLHTYSNPTAPTDLTVSNAVPAAGTRVLLSWSGAAPGGYNDIVSYRVYRSNAEDGSYTQVAVVDSTETAASCYVVAPSTAGGYYYFRVETVGSFSTSGASDKFIAVGARESVDGEDDAVDVIVPPARGRERRRFIFGDYDTGIKGWTLTGWSFPEPDQQTNFVAVPGRSAGPLDMSTALTDGDPRYNGRELTATFECSDGTRLERDDLISEMMNRLHGMRLPIVFPDDATRYAVGRLHVEQNYSDMAHCSVTVTATCDPWRYSQEETRISLLATEDKATVVLYNSGRRLVVPEVVVSGYGARVHLVCGKHKWTLGAGKYKLPELTLAQGNTLLTYSGVGAVSITYREAII